MIEQLKEKDLVITKDKLKNKLIKELSSKLLNIKVVSISEFKNMYFYNYNEETVYYLRHKYNYKYDIIKNILNNIYFIDSLKQELIDNNLLIEKTINMNLFDRVVLYNINVDKYIENELKQYNLIKIEEKKGTYAHYVYKFDSINNEVNFVAIKILDLLNSTNINNINLVNVTNEYETVVKRVFSMYNIPVNLENNFSIYGTNIVQTFLKELHRTSDLNSVIKVLDNSDISNKIIDIINKYSFTIIDDDIKYLIEEELKITKYETIKLINAINTCDINCIDGDKYYFILGFNEGVIPKIHKDDDYFSDNKKNKLKILTSIEKNIIEKNLVINKITNYKNIIITYKLQTPFENYLKSRLIEELNMEEIEDNSINYNYSNKYNKFILSQKLDKLIKYNEMDIDLSLLYNNYKNINYLSYDNKYTNISKELFKKYVNNKLVLSYSSLNNYCLCGFKYYVSNVLKLDKYEETFMTFIGSLFHDVLSKCYNKDFVFDSCFEEYINNKEFNYKEQFFIEKLKKDLIYIIDVLKSQERYCSLDNTEYEQKIYVDKSRDIKITFMGIIDKLKYKKVGNETVIAIIDYKTGNTNINIDNSIYKIGMQLPIYLYLAKNKYKNIKVGGFYLQKIIHNKQTYEKYKEEKEETKKLYKLEGYSNSNINILSLVDKSYENSNMIRGMSVTSKGFSYYTKVLNDDQMDNLYKLVDNSIEETITNILDVKFEINPKQIGEKLLGCEYCKFKDLCYVSKKDIVKLKSINYKEFLGGE